MSNGKTEMSMDEAIKYFESSPVLSTDGDISDEKIDEARLIALSAMKTMLKSLVSIEMDEDHGFDLNINSNIGKMMISQDLSEDKIGQRALCMQVLSYALAAAAKKQVDAGCELASVMEHMLDCLTEGLRTVLGIKIETGKISSDDVDILGSKSKEHLLS